MPHTTHNLLRKTYLNEYITIHYASIIFEVGTPIRGEEHRSSEQLCQNSRKRSPVLAKWLHGDYYRADTQRRIAGEVIHQKEKSCAKARDIEWIAHPGNRGLLFWNISLELGTGRKDSKEAGRGQVMKREAKDFLILFC